MLIEHAALTLSALVQLVRGSALAIRVPAYVPADVCVELTRRLLPDADTGWGYRRIYHSNIRAFTETAGDPSARDAYLSESVFAMAGIRELCRPWYSPVDRLRCELDELWPSGAMLLRLGDRPLVFGMLRIWEQGAQALPHVDVLRESAPDLPDAHGFTGQLGVNIFLQAPAGSQGALAMWDLGLEDLSTSQRRDTGTYGFQRRALPAPEVCLQPRTGDLVLLRSNRIHAVEPTVDGARVTLSGFIGFGDADRPLRLWS